MFCPPQHWAFRDTTLAMMFDEKITKRTTRSIVGLRSGADSGYLYWVLLESHRVLHHFGSPFTSISERNVFFGRGYESGLGRASTAVDWSEATPFTSTDRSHRDGRPRQLYVQPRPLTHIDPNGYPILVSQTPQPIQSTEYGVHCRRIARGLACPS
jgi:hypothetical protein